MIKYDKIKVLCHVCCLQIFWSFYLLVKSVSSSCLNHHSVLFALSLRKVIGVIYRNLMYQWIRSKMIFWLSKKTRKRVTKCLEETKKRGMWKGWRRGLENL